MIYLDNAATTLHKPMSVIKAVENALVHMASPGRGAHEAAMKAADILYECREKAAKLFKMSRPEHVVFTFNATHALNIAIKSLVHHGSSVLISGYEHNAVTRPLNAIEGVKIRVVRSALYCPEQFLKNLETEIVRGADVVICTHVSNVFGYVLPIPEIAALCRKHRKPFVVDASQSAGSLPIDMDGWGASFIAMPGHKGLFGPQGTGLLLCADENIKPLMEGGTGSVSLQVNMPETLPDRLEAGTHNVPGIAGLLEGMKFVERNGTGILLEHERRLALRAAEGLSRIRGVNVFYAPNLINQTGVLSFNIPTMDCEDVAERLGRLGIAVRAGFHCAPLAHQSAGTLESGTVRIGLSPFNRQQEIDCLIGNIKQFTEKG